MPGPSSSRPARRSLSGGAARGACLTPGPSSRSAARPTARVRARAIIAGGLATLAVSTAGALGDTEPFATWYYLFAWSGTLLVLDGLAARRDDGRLPLFGHPARLATLVAWSAVTWLFFELLNARLRNWYYAFVPTSALARRAGVLLAFGTVFPAVFGAETLLDRMGLGRRWTWPALRVTAARRRGLVGAGILALVLPLAWPDVFFPLVWCALTLILDPLNHLRDPARSFLGDLERGRPGRLVRLLAAGGAVGLLWELYNGAARSRWIYTVPLFEGSKVFEMPVAGFLGFPPFALECFAVWQALVLRGLAVPRERRPRRAPVIWRALAVAGGVALSAVGLLALERFTVSSTAPKLADLPGVPAETLRSAGYDVFSLADADPEAVAGRVGVRSDLTETAGRTAASAAAPARAWVEVARLAVHEGIGASNARRLEAAGIRSIADLAAADPDRLGRVLAAAGLDVPPRRLRLWVREARRASERRASRGSSSARAAVAEAEFRGPGRHGRLPPMIRFDPAREASFAGTSLGDRLGRPLRSLRISVTDKCNLRCAYCMPEDDYVWLGRDEILRFEEIAELTGVFTGLGVDRIRLTGGEPLLRRDLDVLVRLLRENPHVRDLALTTNGVLLGRDARALREAGLDRVTVSLDTLVPERFRRLTRRDEHARVLAGIAAAVETGFERLKLNTVVIRGFNDDELTDLLRFGREVGAEVRFIEYMDVGGATRWSPDQVVSRREILERLTRELGPPVAIGEASSAPADRFRLPDGSVFGVISSTTEPFCRACDRARLTTDGVWLLCLYAADGVDLKSLLRGGASRAEIAAAIASAWRARADRGAEERLAVPVRDVLVAVEDLRKDPHREMHTRGG